MCIRMNALAAVNDSTNQLFEQSSIFPAEEPERVLPTTLKRKHPGYAQKSEGGFPSYYAEVGPKGVVSFNKA